LKEQLQQTSKSVNLYSTLKDEQQQQQQLNNNNNNNIYLNLA